MRGPGLEAKKPLMNRLREFFCQRASAAVIEPSRAHDTLKRSSCGETSFCPGEVQRDHYVDESSCVVVEGGSLVDESEFLCVVSDEDVHIRHGPKPWKFRPDRLERRQHLQGCYHQAYLNAKGATEKSIRQGRGASLGLLAIQGLRLVAWLHDEDPVGNIAMSGLFTLHCVTVASDLLVITLTAPLFFFQSLAATIKGGRSGLLLTMVFTLSSIHVGIVVLYCFVMSPKPYNQGRRTAFRVAESHLDIWACMLLASVSLNIGLLSCFWRIYKQLRVNGLYPTDSPPIGFGLKIEEISFWELLCEIADIKRFRKETCAACFPTR